MNYKYYFLSICFCSIFFINCKIQDVTTRLSETKWTNVRPPNCMSLNDTLMCDRTEVSNLSWKEYVMYNHRLFGSESYEYYASLPDTSGYFMPLKAEGAYFELSRNDYCNKEEYEIYPVVGVTLDQAKKYSKWRSDRVMEMMLVDLGVIKHNSDLNIETEFTIENFLQSAEYEKYKAYIQYYPKYYIPTEKDWELLAAKIESQHLNVGIINSIDKAIQHQKNNGFPLIPVRSMKSPLGQQRLYNILGNVSEMIDEHHISIGGSCEDELEDILALEIDEFEDTSQFVGFRNFCVWVPIEEFID